MTNKHTPAPWLIVGNLVYALNDQDYNQFSCLVQDAHTPQEELLANAQLIAAAPELLAALQELVSVTEDSDDTGALDEIALILRFAEALDNAKAVIAKATF